MSTTNNLAVLDQKVNEAILAGKAMDAFDEYYADAVVMQDNSDAPWVGKAFNREREIQFFGSIETLHELKLVSSGVGDDISYSEWIFDLTFKGGAHVRLEQVAVRRWNDGKIVSERFYYKA
ncbi:MAG: nuclear transport factor 2 family protein [Bryobacteraceae bacterium]|nr:nuclear transport factor 2 family protein [Bryobacteraceae bacterium]